MWVTYSLGWLSSHSLGTLFLVILRQGLSLANWIFLTRLGWLANELQFSACLCYPCAEITNLCFIMSSFPHGYWSSLMSSHLYFDPFTNWTNFLLPQSKLLAVYICKIKNKLCTSNKQWHRVMISIPKWRNGNTESTRSHSQQWTGLSRGCKE